jgi:hypothetical protein
VKDLAKVTEFVAAIGFAFDEQFTDENATRMIISDRTSSPSATATGTSGRSSTWTWQLSRRASV